MAAGSGARTEVNHLNSVCIVDRRPLVAAFGPRPKTSTDWRDARAGGVWSERDIVLQPIYHPHSICLVSADEIAVCESPLRRLVTTLGRASRELPGYARGLCVAGDRLFAATSETRHGTGGVLPYDAPKPFPPGKCAISELDVAELDIKRTVELTPVAREVYELIPCAR